MDLSNDGQWLACATMNDADGPTVSVVNTRDGGTTRSYRRASIPCARGVAFVSGGRELVFLFQNAGDDTYLMRAEIGNEAADELQFYPIGTRHHAIIRDQDARRFAILGNHVEIRDAVTNQVLRTLPGAQRHYRVQAAFSRDGERIYVYGAEQKAVVSFDVAPATNSPAGRHLPHPASKCWSRPTNDSCWSQARPTKARTFMTSRTTSA